MSKFTDFFRYYREKANLTQHEVADYLQIPYKTYNHYESCYVEPPLYILFKLLNLYNLNISDYITAS